MKNVVLVLVLIAAVTACQSRGGSATQVAAADPDVVSVYYFHGKARCMTCVAVGDVAKKTVETVYADNKKVRFVEIDTSDKINEALVEKYEVTWNALIITKGCCNKSQADITQQAFATAVNNPQSLENLIKDEVNKRL
jgi:hypothetical protein